MNTQLITDKIHDIVSLLNSANAEAKEIEAKRLALEKSSYVNSDRERSIYAREVTMKKREEDIAAQKLYIEEQSKNTQLVLNKIVIEKEALKGMEIDKREIERERLQLEADKKSFEGMKAEKEKFLQDKAEFEKERQLFSREKLAMKESQTLLAMREVNIKAKEERVNRIERMTQL